MISPKQTDYHPLMMMDWNTLKPYNKKMIIYNVKQNNNNNLTKEIEKKQTNEILYNNTDTINKTRTICIDYIRIKPDIKQIYQNRYKQTQPCTDLYSTFKN